MKHLRLPFGLTIVPLCTLLGSFITIGAGSAIFIGLIVGIALSYFFLTYGPGHAKSPYPKSYYLNQQHQFNGGFNQQAINEATVQAQETYCMTKTHHINPRY